MEKELAEIKEKYKISTQSQCVENKGFEGCPKHELMKEEDFLLHCIPNMIDNEPEKFRLSLFAGILQKYGAFGSERIKLLKQCFRTIIDEVVSLDLKFYVALNREVSFKEIIKIERDKIKYNRKPYKFGKETIEKSPLDMLKEYDFTGSIIDYFEKYGDEIVKRYDTLK